MSRHPLPSPPLLVISDRSQGRHKLTEIAAAAFRGGCRWFSLREKDLPAAERHALLAELTALGRPHGAIVGIHDDVDAVTDAVHLSGGSDLAIARRRLPNALIGISAHTMEEAAAQLCAGADYATLSPIFPSDSKPGYGPALGLDALAKAAALAGGPVIALAGITPANAAACLKAGAAGIAVMGEVMRADDPEAMVRAFIRALSSAESLPHRREG